ncbi:endo-1,4-beta-xylanase [Paenibacillus prosopidis]|uniref:Beta-xylanase n=1 Tax=Paenibacillus prosopidis TaxID=630520 RepID=A0A368W2Y1_9BACL|nr:endo-1,4-beta-xylanase [Paenibacillus prosopidis]RCW48433.1 endo-1,4-beta-xylanase [Paenibacillus prosopidis]
MSSPIIKRRHTLLITLLATAIVVTVLLLNRFEPNGTEADGTGESPAAQQMNEMEVEAAMESIEQTAAPEGETAENGGQAAPAEPSVQTDIPSLAETYADYFPIGAAIEPFQTTGLKAELLKKHVNWLVAENAMKPASLQPTERNFTWENADRIVEFAKESGMEVRFHTLVWHSQVGAWFFKDAEGKPMVDETEPGKREANKKLLLERLDTHVRTIVDRYKDDIKSWDVVNEVIEPGDLDGMRASDWYKITGTDYIETAFRAAREAGGPDAKLYINDYGTDNPAKRDRLYELVKEMLDKGVPIDGVGHQTHIGIHGPSVDSIIESMRKFSELGLDNLVTELDMSIYAWNDRSDFGADIPDNVLKKQADRYRELFEAFKANKDILSGVVFWGIADDHTWLSSFPMKRTEAPLLFDKQLHAKPAFWAVVDSSKLVK